MHSPCGSSAVPTITPRLARTIRAPLFVSRLFYCQRRLEPRHWQHRSRQPWLCVPGSEAQIGAGRETEIQPSLVEMSEWEFLGNDRASFASAIRKGVQATDKRQY